jgi:REP element-mobilizing transposase RayT
MPRYRILDQHGLNYVTCTVVGWVDVFTRKAYRDILLESLAYCRKEKGLIICAYVIMSNHIHMIVRADGELTLSEVLRDFKKYTSRQILEAIAKGNESRKEWMLHVFRYYARFHANGRTHQFWLQDNHPIALVSPKVIWQKVDYIHQNPVRAGWVDKAEEYLYSSARNYMFENEGYLLELDLLEPYLPGSSFVYLPGFDDQE